MLDWIVGVVVTVMTPRSRGPLESNQPPQQGRVGAGQTADLELGAEVLLNFWPLLDSPFVTLRNAFYARVASVVQSVRRPRTSQSGPMGTSGRPAYPALWDMTPRARHQVVRRRLRRGSANRAQILGVSARRRRRRCWRRA
jgi:hypothetical protein